MGTFAIGVAVVGLALVIAIVIGLRAGGNAHDPAHAERVLDELRMMPRAAARAAGPRWARGTPDAVMSKAHTDIARRWRETLEGTNHSLTEGSPFPLPRAAVRLLMDADLPPGMAVTYGMASLAAVDLQQSLGIRDAVAEDVRRSDARQRTVLLEGLQHQHACLTGVYMGSVYGHTVLTEQTVSRLLDVGIVQGTRLATADEWFLRGSRSGDPGTCKAFQGS